MYFLVNDFQYVSSLSVAQQTFNIGNYGAIGNGKAICTLALRHAVDARNHSGGGEVLVPP